MKVFIGNDYDCLQDCILCYPCNLQAVNSNDPNRQVDKNLASVQYNNLLNKLIEHGSKVQFVGLNNSPSQVFARDIGFAVEELLFVSNMTDSSRQSEINVLKELAKKHNIKTHVMEQKVEGGDIIIKNNIVFIGQGNRTNEMAANEIGYILQRNNKPYEIVKVGFDATKIHLDCAFNILNEETCIISSSVYDTEMVAKYFKKVIKIPDEDLSDLAPNIVQLDRRSYLCSSKNFKKILQSHGFNAIYIDFSEFIKCNGGLGCCVLPLLRTENP